MRLKPSAKKRRRRGTNRWTLPACANSCKRPAARPMRSPASTLTRTKRPLPPPRSSTPCAARRWRGLTAARVAAFAPEKAVCAAKPLPAPRPEAAKTRLIARSDRPELLLAAREAGADELALDPRDWRREALDACLAALDGERFALVLPAVGNADVLDGVHAWARGAQGSSHGGVRRQRRPSGHGLGRGGARGLCPQPFQFPRRERNGACALYALAGTDGSADGGHAWGEGTAHLGPRAPDAPAPLSAARGAKTAWPARRLPPLRPRQRTHRRHGAHRPARRGLSAAARGFGRGLRGGRRSTACRTGCCPSSSVSAPARAGC